MYWLRLKRWRPQSAGGPAPGESLTWPLGGGLESNPQLEDAREIERTVTELFDALRSPALRYLLSMGLPPADAEEVVQEVFLALFHHLRKGRPRTNLRGWIFRTAHNLGLKSRQRSSRLRAVAADSVAAEQLADQRPSVEKTLVSRHRLRTIQAVTQALPERDQWCLSLRAEGLSYREIAETLGMSLGAVSISITRSVARMREADR